MHQVWQTKETDGWLLMTRHLASLLLMVRLIGETKAVGYSPILVDSA